MTPHAQTGGGGGWWKREGTSGKSIQRRQAWERGKSAKGGACLARVRTESKLGVHERGGGGRVVSCGEAQRGGRGSGTPNPRHQRVTLSSLLGLCTKDGERGRKDSLPVGPFFPFFPPRRQGETLAQRCNGWCPLC